MITTARLSPLTPVSLPISWGVPRVRWTDPTIRLRIALRRCVAPPGLIDRTLMAVKANTEPTKANNAKECESVAMDDAVDTVIEPVTNDNSPTPSQPSQPSPPPVGEVDEIEDLDRPVRGPHADAATDLTMEDLVREHADAVYRVALSVTRDTMLAEDASQDALIKAWQALPTFRGEAPLRNWILRITHNTAISLLRKRRDELRDPAELPEQFTSRTVESAVQDRIAIERFEVALDDLDPTSRSIVVLREVEGLAYDEICDMLELSMPTVKTRLLRARRQLARALDGWQP